MVNKKYSLNEGFIETFGMGINDFLSGKVSLGDHPESDKIKEFIHDMLGDSKGDDLVRKILSTPSQESPVFSVESAEQVSSKVKQNAIKQQNLDILNEFVNSYYNPNILQNLQTNPGSFFSPTGGSPVHSLARSQQRLVAFYGSPRKRTTSEQKSIDLSVIEEVQNSKMLGSFDGDGTVKFQGGAIWSQLDSPAAVNSYSKFSVNAQKYIETFQDFAGRISNPKSSHNSYLALDIETLGNFDTGDGFHITEISAQGFKYDKETGGHIASNKMSYNWLIKPTKEVYNDMNQLVLELTQNPYKFTQLDSDQKRSLVDLMRYSTESISLNSAVNVNPADFSNLKNGVIHSNVLDLNELYGGSNGKTLNERVLIQNFGSYSKHMLSGMKNLKDHGTDAISVIQDYNNMVEKHKSKYFVTHNGDFFDLTGLRKFGEKISNITGQAIGMNMPKNHLDWMKLLQSTFANPVTMHQMFGKKDKNFIEGPWTIQSFRQTFGWDTQSAHAANYDVGEFGTGGIVNRTWKQVQSIINNARNPEPDADIFRPRSSTLQYSDAPIKKGQTLFSLNAVRNFTGAQDFQGEWQNGKLEPLNPGFNKNVLDAESFYEMGGIRKVSENKYALELVNQDTGVFSYIVREGEDARHQISQFINQNLQVADDMASGHGEITGSHTRDLARRRYQDLLGLRQGYTRGFEAAKRMFNNVGAVIDNPNLSIDELINQGLLDFNSLYDGGFNESEAKQFQEFLPRMMSERNAYGEAIDAIERRFAVNPEMEGWEKRNVNIQRSLALQLFSEELDSKVGAHRELRPKLPYEQKVLEFNDVITDRKKTINLNTPTSAHEGILSYVFADHRSHEGDPAKQSQASRERYIAFLSSLQESGYMQRSQLRAMVQDYHDSGLSPAIHSKRLAVELANNHAILDRIRGDGMIETESVARRRAVEELSKEQAREMAVTAGKRAGDVSGQFIHNNNLRTTILTDELLRGLSPLDQPHDITGLQANHAVAIKRLLDRFTKFPGIGAAITMNDDNSVAYLNLFDESYSDSVMSQLAKGNNHPNAIQVAMPLIDENGTMQYGYQRLNAMSHLIMRDGKVQKVSSFEKMADAIESRASSISKHIREGTIDKGQYSADATVRDELNELSGTKRNFGGENDTMVWKNTRADILKQGNLDPTSAMVHNLYGSQITNEHLQDSAFKNGKLKTYLNASDLTPDGLELLNRIKSDWAQEHGYETYANSLKSDKYVDVMLNTVDATETMALGAYSKQGRDNLVQRLNVYEMDEKFQRNLMKISDEVYLNFDDMISSPLDGRMVEKMGSTDAPYVNVKMAFMTQGEIDTRIAQMMETDAGLDLLREEGIIDADGKVNEIRMPTVYEQQTVMNNALIERLHMRQTKFFDIGENLKFADDLINSATGELRKNVRVEPGQVIGTHFVNGVEEKLIYDHDVAGRITMNEGRIGVSYYEQAHKLFFNMEKTTPGGGWKNYSTKFLEAFTGITGVAGIFNPDIVKHEDYDEILTGQLKRVVDHINNLDGEERAVAVQSTEEAIEAARASGKTLGVEFNESQTGFIDTSKREGLKDYDAAGLSSLLERLGISEVETIADNTYGLANQQTPTGIMSMGIAQVSDYSRTVGESDGMNDKGVKYGPRELDVLKRRGAEVTHDFLREMIKDKNQDNVRIMEGMLDSLRSMAVDPSELDFEEGVTQVWRAKDFEGLPETYRDRGTYSHTIMDMERIQRAEGYDPETSKRHGFWFQLPDVAEDMAITMDGRKVDKMFIPYVDVKGKGNEVWTQQIHRLNADIYRRSAELESAINTPKADEAGNPIQSHVVDARNRLQSAVEAYESHLRRDLTSSKGFVAENVAKTKLENSSSGITKIVTPKLSQELAEEIVTISTSEAEKLGILDWQKNNKGKDFYVPSLRYPTFHSDAIQFAKLRVSDDVQDGHQHITSMVAEYLRADSDGDYNHIVALFDEAVQEDMKGAYNRQATEHAEMLSRFDSAESAIKHFDSVWENSRQAALNDLFENEKLELQEDGSYNYGEDRGKFTLADIQNEDGVIKAYNPRNQEVRFEEHTAKYGKALVGQASNINYRMRQLSLEHLQGDDLQRARYAIEKFGTGLEQKIISAKHGDDRKIEISARSGSLEFIQALQRSDWSEALRIDEQQLGGMFTKDFMLEEAVAGMQLVENRAGKQAFWNQSLKAGTSGGIPEQTSGGRRITVDEVLGIFENRDPNATNVNGLVEMVRNYIGAPTEGTPPTPEPETSTPSEPSYLAGTETPYQEPNIPQGTYTPPPAPETSSYQERGLLKHFGAVLGEGVTGKIGVGLGIAGGLGITGLMLTNMTSGENLTPESMPHNDEQMQYHHTPYMPGVQQTARLEESGTGYNKGMRVSVRGSVANGLANEEIGSLAGQALNQSGINANINIRSQDDSKSIDQEWLQQQFTQLVNNGYVN